MSAPLCGDPVDWDERTRDGLCPDCQEQVDVAAERELGPEVPE